MRNFDDIERARRIVVDFLLETPTAVPAWDEVAAGEDGLRMSISDGSELPPECHSEIGTLLGAAGLGEVPVEYVHTDEPIVLY